jgi:hypothetical protein
VFKGSPAHVSALSGPTVRSASGRLPQGHRLEQRHPRPGFPSPFGRRHPLVGHPVPPRDCAPLAIGLPGVDTTRTPTGFPRFAYTRHDRGGCPLNPETSGVPTTDSHYPIAACRLFQRPGPITLVFIPSSRARNNEASTGIHLRSPVRSSPRPLLPRTEQGPFGFYPGLRTPTDKARRRTPERGSISNTDRELRTRHNRPPTCEFTRHTRPRVARGKVLCVTPGDLVWSHSTELGSWAYKPRGEIAGDAVREVGVTHGTDEPRNNRNLGTDALCGGGR